ncbi:hypothetical protein C0J52_04508 [Blattella germanica]|nr:hypothetical protein C0J52_04508 [Blattella germanica]
MPSPKVEQIASSVILGEGPHWDHNAQALYYVDIKGSTVNKYVPATKKHTTVKIGTMGRDLEKVDEYVQEIGSLFSFDKNWKPTTQVTKVTVSNGLAWTEDLKHMYYIDSPTKCVHAFDYDAKTAKILKNGVEGLPDGMAIDTEGKLWVACFGGSQVIRVDPVSGELLTKIPIPSSQVTSVVFGGPQLDELYVTSANVKLSDAELKKNPGSGEFEMASPKVEQIAPSITLGEGPHWDHSTQTLYYVDINNSTVSKYVPATKKHTTVKIEGGPVSLVIPLEGEKDKFVITVGRNVAIMTWDGETSTPSEVKYVAVVDTEKGQENNRINDGKADPTGRLWAGTMGINVAKEDEFVPDAGSLFSFDKNWKPTTHETKITVSNGLAWNEKLKQMYYIDSPTKCVHAFDYDAKTAKISNKRIAFDYAINGVEGFPDGMTIDTEGKLWVACFFGSQVIRVDPIEGKLLTQIPIPSSQVTSVAFGGPQLDELYVTSANINLSEADLKKNPGSGGTFRVTGVGAKGYPAQNIKLELGEKDKFVISVGRNVAIMTWDGEMSTPSEVKYVAAVDTEKGQENNRLNDGKADPTGRLWAGTMGINEATEEKLIPEAGSLFSFDKNWKPTTHITKVTASNGMAWNEEQKQMYYIDTLTKCVHVFDYEAETAKILNKRIAFDYAENGVEGVPDGMTTDNEGKLWVACFLGSQVIQVDPAEGKLLTQIPIPASQVSSVAFGGPQLDELYVTSANINLNIPHLKKNSGDGCVFRVTGLGAKGYPGQNVIL